MFILNVLECVDCLNEKATHFDTYSDGSRGRILKYSFHLDKIQKSNLFKIPETSKTEILTYLDPKDNEEGFIDLYKKLGFKGLVFKRVFSES